MASIFISYRRQDAAGWAGRLAADLRREFPQTEVFQDIASIGIGEDFVDAMRRALESCAVAIVLIGPHWLDARDEQGQRRLDDPEDWVRLEIEESLKRSGLRVVPLLVGNATMPRAADLPASLRLLARRNAHEISDRRWDYDFGELVKALKPVAALAGGPKPGSEQPAARGVEWLPGKVFRDGDDGPEMVVIRAGEFLMGSPKSEAGRSDDEGPQHRVRIGKPFALGRYATTSAYPWGDEAGSGHANFSGAGSEWSGRRTSPVGSFAANAFGLCDMIGNVWEWLQDCWNETYTGAPDDGRAWESGDCGRRVVRGGSWYSGPEDARAAYRNGVVPGLRLNNLGFRLARTL